MHPMKCACESKIKNKRIIVQNNKPKATAGSGL